MEYRNKPASSVSAHVAHVMALFWEAEGAGNIDNQKRINGKISFEIESPIEKDRLLVFKEYKRHIEGFAGHENPQIEWLYCVTHIPHMEHMNKYLVLIDGIPVVLFKDYGEGDPKDIFRWKPVLMEALDYLGY